MRNDDCYLSRHLLHQAEALLPLVRPLLRLPHPVQSQLLVLPLLQLQLQLRLAQLLLHLVLLGPRLVQLPAQARHFLPQQALIFLKTLEMKMSLNITEHYQFGNNM